MTSFRIHDDVAVVEHDDGGVLPGTVEVAHAGYFAVRTERSELTSFWESPGGVISACGRWRLVPVCRCENPILGTPTTDPEDPTGRQFCSEDCLTDEAEQAGGAFAVIEYNTEFD